MAGKASKGIVCSICATRECRKDYPKGIPDYCVASSFPDIIEQTKSQYSAPDAIDIYRAASRVAVDAKGNLRPRIVEAIEFARELKVKKVGLASCISLIRELAMVGELFTGAGFEVVSVACQVGRVKPEARGVPELKGLHSSTCNPIAQAEILNREGTELNYVLGLCLGHDILFTRHSRAPASTLIVKDRVTGNNPAAALYSSHHRRAIWKQYCGKDVD